MPNSLYKILVLSWNTESVSLCETMDCEVANNHRTSYSSYIPGMTTWKYSCDTPDFYPKLSRFITDNDPDLVVIGFQEDRFPGSYFHSHLLPEEMPKIGYSLVKRTKLMGLGITSYKGAMKGDLFERGIRLSVYAKDNLAPLIEQEEKEMRAVIGNDGQSEYVCSNALVRGKGAVVSYIILPGYGRLAFVCCHLPFNAKSLTHSRINNNDMIRQTELNYSNYCFNSIVENLILFGGPVPNHVIYFGDFNYRLADPRPSKEVGDDLIAHANNVQYLSDLYDKYDELKDQMDRNNIYRFNEGINNDGPMFLPTCKLYKNRITDNPDDSADHGQIPTKNFWKQGKHNQRIPSWCDRILYGSLNSDNHSIICTYYDRFDVGTLMSKSDHAAVMGIYHLI